MTQTLFVLVTKSGICKTDGIFIFYFSFAFQALFDNFFDKLI